MRQTSYSQSALTLVLAALSGPLGHALVQSALAMPIPINSTVLSFIALAAGYLLAMGLVFCLLFFGTGAPMVVVWVRLRRRARAASDAKRIWQRLEHHDVVLLLSIPISWLGFVLAPPMRELHRGLLLKATGRAQPILAALEHYRRDAERYPRTLADLAPRYLQDVPSTGMLAYPEFDYEAPARANGAVPYELWVSMPLGPSVDVLLYSPTKTYPSSLYPSRVIPVGEWAYIPD